jgi:single-strand DNA-binding protein
MSGVNKVIIVGRLGRDPELRYLQNGNPVCKLNIATSEKYTNKEHQLVETTEWHRVTIWGKPAENAAKFLAKGSLVYIEGKLKTNTYEKDGQKHWVTEILATNVQYLSTKAENKENSERSGNSGSNSNSGNSNQGSGRRPSNNGASNSGGFNDEPPGSNEMPDFNDFGGNPGDDDIPF